MTDQTAPDTEPTSLPAALVELRHARVEIARLTPFVAVADGASRAAEHWENEAKRWLAFIQRGMDTHTQFSLLHPDGTVEKLPCADWCYACRIERAEAELRRYAEADSADAAAGSYAHRAEQAEAAVKRAQERCQAVRDRVGPGGMINASQILGLLSPTWPDGNYEAPQPSTTPNEPWRYATTWAEYGAGRAALDGTEQPREQ
jgi:hypothetical protein